MGGQGWSLSRRVFVCFPEHLLEACYEGVNVVGADADAGGRCNIVARVGSVT